MFPFQRESFQLKKIYDSTLKRRQSNVKMINDKIKNDSFYCNFITLKKTSDLTNTRKYNRVHCMRFNQTCQT